MNWKLGVEMIERHFVSRLARLSYLLGASVTFLAAAADDEMSGLAGPSGQSGHVMRTQCAGAVPEKEPDAVTTDEEPAKAVDEAAKTDPPAAGGAAQRRQSFPDFVPWGN